MLNVLQELRKNAKESGVKEALKIMFKKYGWKVGLAIFMYYLIRDVTLYIILPYLIMRGFFSG
tara:strand:+ start:2970 stop:3158 length:189 start_codon:yes stop_codon:yes gene_type:complete